MYRKHHNGQIGWRLAPFGRPLIDKRNIALL
jgi:hypothetical protein